MKDGFNVTTNAIEHIVSRLSDDASPEARLICCAIAHWIDDEVQLAALQHEAGQARSGLRPFGAPWWSGGFVAYAMAIGVSAETLIELGREVLFVRIHPAIHVDGIGSTVTLSTALTRSMDRAQVAHLRRAIRRNAQAFHTNWGCQGRPATSQKGGEYVSP